MFSCDLLKLVLCFTAGRHFLRKKKKTSMYYNDINILPRLEIYLQWNLQWKWVIKWEKHGRVVQSTVKKTSIQVAIYLFKVNNKKTRTMSEICSKLTIKKPEWCQWRRYGVIIFNFEQISHISHKWRLGG